MANLGFCINVGGVHLCKAEVTPRDSQILPTIPSLQISPSSHGRAVSRCFQEEHEGERACCPWLSKRVSAWTWGEEMAQFSILLRVLINSAEENINSLGDIPQPLQQVLGLWEDPGGLLDVNGDLRIVLHLPVAQGNHYDLSGLEVITFPLFSKGVMALEEGRVVQWKDGFDIANSCSSNLTGKVIVDFIEAMGNIVASHFSFLSKVM